MSTPELIPGADAFSAEGGPHGALVLHGFTGNPGSMRGLAEAFAAAGFAVELPRLAGHGTTVEDMLTTGWDDWTADVEDAYQRLAARVDKIVVAGLSMGGALTAWTILEHPEVAGAVFINAVIVPSPDMRHLVQGLVDAGETVMAGIGSDIAKPDVVETAYTDTPLAPLLTMMDGLAEMDGKLPSATMPALIMTSPQDHVVDPSNSDHLAEHLGGPVERVSLDRSYHVATMDHDKDLINERAVDFARRVTA